MFCLCFYNAPAVDFAKIHYCGFVFHLFCCSWRRHKRFKSRVALPGFALHCSGCICISYIFYLPLFVSSFLFCVKGSKAKTSCLSWKIFHGTAWLVGLILSASEKDYHLNFFLIFRYLYFVICILWFVFVAVHCSGCSGFEGESN